MRGPVLDRSKCFSWREAGGADCWEESIGGGGRRAARRPASDRGASVCRCRHGDLANCREQRLRLEPPAVIAVDVRETDDAVTVDDERRRRRQAPAVVPVQLRELDLRRLVNGARLAFEREGKSATALPTSLTTVKPRLFFSANESELSGVIGETATSCAPAPRATDDLPVRLQLHVAV